jgi:peptide/nickel transport system substrate-binding protein
VRINKSKNLVGLLKKKNSKNDKAINSLPDQGRGVFLAKKNESLSGGEVDKKLVYSLSRSRFPSWRQLKHVGRFLSPKESFFLRIFSTLIFVSAVFLGVNFYHEHLKTVPVFGGQYLEGVLGAPQHINPLYSSINDVDADLVSLIYSSLFKFNERGELEKDLVEDYSISDDGKTYSLKIREGVKWHQGEELSVDDIFFTFQAIKDPAYNSPLKPTFGGIELKIEDDRTVIFTLAESYAPFLNLLTFGIMPVSVWGQIPPQSAPLADVNLKPIGSGPYQVDSWVKDKSGNIKTYRLKANKDYYKGGPLIKDLVFKFYGGFTDAINALNNGEVDGLSYLPKSERSNLIAKSSLNLNKLSMPKVRAVFFNSDANPLFKDKSVRQALAMASPREKIISEVAGSEADPAYGPIPKSNFAYESDLERYDFDLAKAEKVLSDAGWKKEILTADDIAALQVREGEGSASSSLSESEKFKLSLGEGQWLYKDELKNKNDKKSQETKRVYLTLSLTVLNDDENSDAGRFLSQSWEELGVKVNLNLVSAASVQASVLKPRRYEALLFSELVGNDPDVYFFWHSSQAGEGGLNLSNYKNEEADKLLEDGRTALVREDRVSKYSQFQKLVNQDVAAIFLYSPYYIYPQSKKVKNFSVMTISDPADRFAGIENWYIKTGRRFEW